MIAGMGTTALAHDAVLAGPIEFSPADIAAIVAVLAALFVLVTALGWAMLGWAFGRRRRTRESGWSCPAVVGGCGAGLLLSAGLCAGISALLSDAGTAAGVVAVAVSWVACWVLAAALVREAPTESHGHDAVNAPRTR